MRVTRSARASSIRRSCCATAPSAWRQWPPNWACSQPDLVAQGLIQLIFDDSKAGAIMRVTAQNGIDYARDMSLRAGAGTAHRPHRGRCAVLFVHVAATVGAAGPYATG